MSTKNSNKLNVPEAKAAMNKFKMEAASDKEEPNKKAVDDLLACLDDADAAVSPAEKPKAHISEKKAERKKSVPVR